VKIWKLHALGNHFVFTDFEESIDYPALAQKLCRDRISIGGDGLLSIDFKATVPVVRMWNPDGSEDFCGNGLCCAAFLSHRLGLTELTSLETPFARVPVSVLPLNNSLAEVTIEIATGTFDPTRIPLALEHAYSNHPGLQLIAGGRKFDVITVNNGNIHTVIFVDELPGDEEFLRFGPLIENHPLFPSRTNVLWCANRDGNLHLRIWERGVGETLACGTGSVASVAACARAGLDLQEAVRVVMRGGTARVSMRQEAATFTTRAELVFEGALIQG